MKKKDLLPPRLREKGIIVLVDEADAKIAAEALDQLMYKKDLPAKTDFVRCYSGRLVLMTSISVFYNVRICNKLIDEKDNLLIVEHMADLKTFTEELVALS